MREKIMNYELLGQLSYTVPLFFILGQKHTISNENDNDIHIQMILKFTMTHLIVGSSVESKFNTERVYIWKKLLPTECILEVKLLLSECIF